MLKNNYGFSTELLQQFNVEPVTCSLEAMERRAGTVEFFLKQAVDAMVAPAHDKNMVQAYEDAIGFVNAVVQNTVAMLCLKSKGDEAGARAERNRVLAMLNWEASRSFRVDVLDRDAEGRKIDGGAGTHRMLRGKQLMWFVKTVNIGGETLLLVSVQAPFVREGEVLKLTGNYTITPSLAEGTEFILSQHPDGLPLDQQLLERVRLRLRDLSDVSRLRPYTQRLLLPELNELLEDEQRRQHERDRHSMANILGDTPNTVQQRWKEANSPQQPNVDDEDLLQMFSNNDDSEPQGEAADRKRVFSGFLQGLLKKKAQSVHDEAETAGSETTAEENSGIKTGMDATVNSDTTDGDVSSENASDGEGWGDEPVPDWMVEYERSTNNQDSKVLPVDDGTAMQDETSDTDISGGGNETTVEDEQDENKDSIGEQHHPQQNHDAPSTTDTTLIETVDNDDVLPTPLGETQDERSADDAVPQPILDTDTQVFSLPKEFTSFSTAPHNIQQHPNPGTTKQ